MSLVDYFTRKPEFDIVTMEEADCLPAADLHRQRFAAPWSDGDLHGLLVQGPVFGLVARQSNAVCGASPAASYWPAPWRMRRKS